MVAHDARTWDLGFAAGIQIPGGGNISTFLLIKKKIKFIIHWLQVVSSLFPTPSHNAEYVMPLAKIRNLRHPHDPLLVEKANDLARHMLPPGLLVVHDTGRGGEDNVPELTSGEQLDDPLLEIGQADVVTGRDDTGLVETVDMTHESARNRRSEKRKVCPRIKATIYLPAVQLDNNLARAVVVNLLKGTDVA